jgi:hypothetical protein
MAPVKLTGKSIQVEVWTDRLRISGNLFIPVSLQAAYNGRLSDFLNDVQKTFIPLTNVTVGHIGGSDVLWEGEFLAINKNSISLVRALKE